MSHLRSCDWQHRDTLGKGLLWIAEQAPGLTMADEHCMWESEAVRS